MNNWGPHKSTIFGWDANITALVTYAVSIVILFIPGINFISWLVPISFYFMEKKSYFVKFHAMQAFLLNLAGIVLKLVIGLLLGGNIVALIFSPGSVLNWGTFVMVIMAKGIISLVIIVFEVIAIVKSYGYEEYCIPIIENVVYKIMGNN